jgi:sulfonate transport system substrate-binding protein
MKRRKFLKLSLASAAGVVLSSAVRAEDQPKVVRIGTQKGDFFFPAVRQRHTVEDAFEPLGVDVQ